MDDQQQGGLTGATGNLTPSDPDDEFVPAETREINDPHAARQVTAETHRRAEARREEQSDQPGRLIYREDDTAPNDRDGGYGSEKGLAADDPAYRLEEKALPPAIDDPLPAGAGPILGGDERHDPEEEHF
jgi:hypothetical protein